MLCSTYEKANPHSVNSCFDYTRATAGLTFPVSVIITDGVKYKYDQQVV